MSYQKKFQRTELKYLITLAQKQWLLTEMAPFMTLDKFGYTVIENIYFDTPDYRLIRRSVEKPEYKEKLRVRRYGGNPHKVFVELKKKYKKVVYKRRIGMNIAEAKAWLTEGGDPPQSQIGKEIDYFLRFYEGIRPAAFLSYERQAFVGIEQKDFRVTFDQNIMCRTHHLDFDTAAHSERVLQEDRCIMEVKAAGGMPLWFARLLSADGIYKTSFSKYGTAYQTIIFPKRREGNERYV